MEHVRAFGRIEIGSVSALARTRADNFTAMERTSSLTRLLHRSLLTASCREIYEDDASAKIYSARHGCFFKNLRRTERRNDIALEFERLRLKSPRREMNELILLVPACSSRGEDEPGDASLCRVVP